METARMIALAVVVLMTCHALPASAQQRDEAAAARATLAPRDDTPRDTSAHPLGVKGLDVGGDTNVREELNRSTLDPTPHLRTTMIARLHASYTLVPGLTVGARLATGDRNDPNSSTVTLGGFDDDLAVSLDQAWLRYTRGGTTSYLGKFPQLFERTNMVWDGDVVPQGVGATQSLSLGHGMTLDGRGMYFVLNSDPLGKGSAMRGGQLVFSAAGAVWQMKLSGAYYDYLISSTLGEDAGDYRSNLVQQERYLSGFDLVDGIAAVSYHGFGERLPLSLQVDYVHNFGAAVSEDSGVDAQLSLGRAAAPRDWRLVYDYSRVGVDAVFAAFSHDSITIATSYVMHGLSLDVVPAEHVVLNATWYHFRPLSSRYAGEDRMNDWHERLRANVSVTF